MDWKIKRTVWCRQHAEHVRSRPETYELYASLLTDVTMLMVEQAQSPLDRTGAVIKEALGCSRRRGADDVEFWSAADLACHETRTALALGRPQVAARAALAAPDHAAFPRNHTIYTVRLTSVLTRVGQLDRAIDVTSRAVQNADLPRGSRRIKHRPPAHGRPPRPPVVRARANLRGGGAQAPGRRVTDGEHGAGLDDLTITLCRRGTALAQIDAIAHSCSTAVRWSCRGRRSQWSRHRRSSA
jgi:hypothetical protein